VREGERRRADEVARVQVELAAAAAGVTPLAELGRTTHDLTRVLPLLEQLAGAVASLLSTDLAVVWTSAPDEDVLLPSAWVGFPDDYIRPLRVPYGTASAGRAVLERRTVLVEDVSTSPHYGVFAAAAVEHAEQRRALRAALLDELATSLLEHLAVLSQLRDHLAHGLLLAAQDRLVAAQDLVLAKAEVPHELLLAQGHLANYGAQVFERRPVVFERTSALLHQLVAARHVDIDPAERVILGHEEKYASGRVTTDGFL